MPGQSRLSVDQLAREAAELSSLDIPAILLFGLPASKDAQGSEAWAADGIIQQAVRELKDADPDLVVITDVCLCEYTDHGHCGLVDDQGRVINDASVELLAQTAVSQAEAGADIIAPSDMMDGRIGVIREALDESGFEELTLLSYAAKFASAFYGPFRDAADSAPAFGDRRAYQMDPANGREALRAIERDLAEGADMVMVKPALAWLDVVPRRAPPLRCPAGGLQRERRVLDGQSGRRQWLDRRGADRAGDADRHPPRGGRLILTYHAKDAARWLARRSS